MTIPTYCLVYNQIVPLTVHYHIKTNKARLANKWVLVILIEFSTYIKSWFRFSNFFLHPRYWVANTNNNNNNNTTKLIRDWLLKRSEIKSTVKSC